MSAGIVQTFRDTLRKRRVRGPGFMSRAFSARGSRGQQCPRHTVRGIFAFVLILTAIAFAQTNGGLSKDQVLKLLQQDPMARVQFLVNKYGISFSLTPDVEKELTHAGATPDLLDTLRKLSPPPAKPAPPPMADLMIHAQPADAEVYVDDERKGTTSTEGTLKVSNLAPGPHKVRIARQGFHNFEMSVEVYEGKANTIVGTLQPNEPLPPEPKPVAPEPEKAKAAAPAEVAPVEKKPADPNDPLAPHEAGIYLVDATGGAHMAKLDPAPYSGPQPKVGRGGGFGAFGGGFGKMKWTSVIYGSKAHLRLTDKHPTFYFYFAAPGGNPAGGSYAFQNASSPNEFILTKMESKKNERDIPGSGGASSAVPPKDLVEFSYEKVGTGIYKVQPKADFVPGEYGFLYGGVLSAMGGSGLFDFGVDGKK